MPWPRTITSTIQGTTTSISQHMLHQKQSLHVFNWSTLNEFHWLAMHATSRQALQTASAHPVESKRSLGFGNHIGSKMVTERWFKKRPKLWGAHSGCPNGGLFSGPHSDPETGDTNSFTRLPPNLFFSITSVIRLTNTTLLVPARSCRSTNQQEVWSSATNKIEFLGDPRLYAWNTRCSNSKCTQNQQCNLLMYTLPNSPSS